jgi:hypothetical protein
MPKFRTVTTPSPSSLADTPLFVRQRGTPNISISLSSKLEREITKGTIKVKEKGSKNEKDKSSLCFFLSLALCILKENTVVPTSRTLSEITFSEAHALTSKQGGAVLDKGRKSSSIHVGIRRQSKFTYLALTYTPLSCPKLTKLL